jgi:hypothetical protein
VTVFDCFLFNDELDILEIRLNTLAPVVDVFVLVESFLTFAGTAKPMHYRLHSKRFADFNIRHVSVPLGDAPNRWAREYASRDAAMEALHDAQPDDYVMFGDVDEIPDPEMVRARAIGANWQRMYRYYLNMHTTERCANTVCMWRENVVSMSRIRRYAISELQQFGGGWHFSTTGDVVEKLRTQSHTEFDTEAWHAKAAANRAALRDPLGRNFQLSVDSLALLPPYVQANAERFSHLIYKP